ncbi:DUF6520 family protein [Sinomicrobium weinanense]|uniref:Secreted protein n=1 Tax=Sinomicrobium weinanense TaxID=2842200 RepID=A0A926Q162_9FLAO|nr:DUF6520 family protein [Sinomicrobium weinanense]MBC9795383.1 hypothetical protein [Sinomicrobium weinanense]MBU3122902.1 hypothetical protein [Sinomicrobium weinanense]
MKTKFLLPVLALIFATGMSFATANLNADPNFDYIQRNGWEMIPEVTTCTPDAQPCLGESQSDGLIYQVFDSPNELDPKSGNGEVEAELP